MRAFLATLLTACVAFAAAQAPAAPSGGGDATDPVLRVLLAEGVERFDVHVGEPHEVRTERAAMRSATPLRWPVEVRDGALYAAGFAVGPWLTLAPESGVVEVDGRRYRGALRLEVADGALRLVNVVDLEGYLRGVVPAEVPAEWPAAALEAQAIAARTYTLANLDPAAPYDICATLLCQVYEGVDAEDPRTDAAVRATEGRVVQVGGEVARTYYHADSGGRTASAAEVWGYDRPYLRGRTDVAVASPHRGWTATLAPGRLAAALAAEGRDVGTPTRLEITATSASGRASRARIDGTGGSVTLAGPRLTRTLRAAGLKSTRVTSVGPLTLRGDGWGHGVGLSQYGAMGLARQGRTAEEILAFYYPGTRVATLTRDVWLAAR